MKKRPNRRTSLLILTAGLFLLQAGSSAQNLPALAASAITSASPAPVDKSGSEAMSLSIPSDTQGNFGKLGIGAGYMGGGPYIDEKDTRQNGLHASLSITVDGMPDAFTQPDVHEGQTLLIADYRIHVEKIVPASASTGTIVLRVWPPPKQLVKVRKSWLSIFGL
ncbi:MAG TPA: hypothetical protein VN915_09130 [Elusimicrobiota bacterium]|nr:hypothetical protein [Elusimicrobiota bacterium]